MNVSARPLLPRRLLPLIAAALAAFCALHAGADASVGRLLAASGAVKLDAFGKGAFIAALKGDLLYRESVLKVPADGTATVEIGQKTHQAPPGATLRVADLLGAAERKAGLRWADALGRLISGVGRSVKGSEEEVALGSRAAEQGDTTDSVSWSVEESSDEERYRAGREKIETGDPAGALRELLAVEADSADAYGAAELAFWRGHCHFELGDYAGAEGYLQSARRGLEADALSLDAALGRALFLELGASQFYLGRPADSVPSLRVVVRDRRPDDRTLYAYLFLVEALSSAGDRAGAAAELRDAEKLFAGSPSAGQLADLRKKLTL